MTLPKLVCSKALWTEIVSELHKRTSCSRESGAYLLGRRNWLGALRILHPVYYDDIDPACFEHGYVLLNGAQLGKLWRICRERNMDVVADVHVHPGGYSQSESDQQNPMMANSGHIALILPHFARGNCPPGQIGIYEHIGARRWRNHSRSAGRFFRVGSLLWNL